MESEALAQLLDRSYGIRPRAVVELRTVRGILADDGSQWIWKWGMPRGKEDSLAVLDRIAANVQSERLHLVRAVPALNGELVTRSEDGQHGYLQPWVHGRHVDLRDAGEFNLAINTIGRLHRTTRGQLRQLMPAPGQGQRLPLLTKLYAKQETLATIWPEAARHLTELRSMEVYCFATMDAVIEVYLQGRPVTPVFCHRDLAPHNQLLLPGSTIALIDFDQAGFDDPFGDLMQLANHAVMLGQPKAGLLTHAVDEYLRVNEVERDRVRQLWQLLRFPDLMVRAVGEWVKAGCPARRAVRVRAAIQKEKDRAQLWVNDVS